LRPHLAAAQDRDDPHYVYVWDKLRLNRQPQRLNLLEFWGIQRFDGRRSLRDVQVEAIRQFGGQMVPLELFAGLAQKMEAALFLDGPRYRQQLAGPIREPSCIGCYEAEPEALRAQLLRLFTGPRGPGLPHDPRPNGRLCAALLPHIDYERGGATIAWGFKELFERTDAALFVIVGTSHHSAHRFALTRKHFRTPLGVVPTDHAYIDRLMAYYGDGLFDDEAAHLPEHSIELEVVLLQYLYENRRPIRIVPLLVGSFLDCVLLESAPSARVDIGRMLEALRQAEAQTPEPICYIISGDLAHLGPKFGDPEPVGDRFLSRSRVQDQALLERAEAADARGYFEVIAGEGDSRRICGMPPTYTVLEAIHPTRGQVLHYGQYVHPRGHESVSFASVAFYR
jgi:AmmeMemoRadiSam system protein B